MKQFNSIIFTLIGLLMLITSCNKGKSYSDHLKDEKRAIDLLIEKNNFTILGNFPANGKFGEKEFYKDPETEVYFNIIDYGDTTQMPKLKEMIYIRFKGLHYIKGNDTTTYSNYRSTFPERLEYVGPVSETTRASYANAGWAVPLSYVGHRGKVKLIIPFNMGASYDQSKYETTYYEQVEYRFDNQW